MKTKEDKMKSLKEIEEKMDSIKSQFKDLKLYKKIIESVPNGTVIYCKNTDFNPEGCEEYDKEAIPILSLSATWSKPWSPWEWLMVTKTLVKDGELSIIEIWDCEYEELVETELDVWDCIENFNFLKDLIYCIEQGWTIPEDQLDKVKFQHL